MLSFLTWVRFEAEGAIAGRPTVVEISGLDTSMWRDDESIDDHSTAPRGIGWCSCEVGFGDGYITAALGLALVALASAAALTEFTGRALLGAVAAALAALVAAGFNAFADWSALVSVTNAGTTVAAEGEVQWALYALLAAAALAAVLAAAGWVADWAYEEEEEYDYEDENGEEPTGGDSWVSA